jgi:hypothetical protein
LPSAYDIIKSTIQAGSVYYYYDEALKSSKQHNFIVININPSKGTVIFLVCSSSQIDKTRRRRKSFPSETLVEITPNQYPGFSKKSIVDCNHIFPKNINDIARMLSRNKLQIKPVMGLRLVRQLRQGVILSPAVANEVKMLLQTD